MSYRIPESGIYQHDMLAGQVAGPDGKETEWGSLNFTSRLITFQYPTEESKRAAEARFLETGIFRVLSD